MVFELYDHNPHEFIWVLSRMMRNHMNLFGFWRVGLSDMRTNETPPYISLDSITSSYTIPFNLTDVTSVIVPTVNKTTNKSGKLKPLVSFHKAY